MTSGPAKLRPANGAIGPPAAALSGFGRARAAARALAELTKPGIIGLLLVTTAPTMVLAADGWPGLDLILLTLLGGMLTAGGANALNQWYDRDIDAVMARTRGRPLPMQALPPNAALAWGTALVAAGGVQIALTVNLLSAGLALAAAAFYVFAYTIWLKRRTPQNIVIGGAAGAVPPLVGWAAVTGDVSWTAVLLFAVIFLWTPPHFWALSLKYRDEYAEAGVPMLPVAAGEAETRKQILIYAVILVAVSLIGPAAGHLGWCYEATAAVAGAAFIWFAWRLYAGKDAPMRVFFASIAYLAIIFAAVGLDVLV